MEPVRKNKRLLESELGILQKKEEKSLQQKKRRMQSVATKDCQKSGLKPEKIKITQFLHAPKTTATCTKTTQESNTRDKACTSSIQELVASLDVHVVEDPSLETTLSEVVKGNYFL